MSEEKKWYCSDCRGRLWPTCYYCNEPMTTEDAQEIKAHLEQCEKRPPPEMQQLVEWLEEQGTIESKEELRARGAGQNELRVYASSRVDAYNQVLDYIRTEFLGGKK